MKLLNKFRSNSSKFTNEMKKMIEQTKNFRMNKVRKPAKIIAHVNIVLYLNKK